MAVERCFARFGVTHGGAWQATILKRSGHWPQHLATYLHAALTVLKSNAPSAEVMGDARRSALTEAIALGDAGRKAYYGRRLQSLTRDNPLFRDYATDLAEKLQRTDRPPLESEITRNIMERHGISVESAAGFLRKAKHSGLLDTDDEGRCSMPIPSFAKHLLGEASRSPNRPETAWRRNAHRPSPSRLPDARPLNPRASHLATPHRAEIQKPTEIHPHQSARSFA